MDLRPNFAMPMHPPIRLALVLHNHQPVGNFDHVFEQAYEDSYRPFLDVFEPFADLRIALHTSGPLMEWLDEKHPEYLERLRFLVSSGRIEIVGGAFYEPILSMIPSRDRIGQIRSYTDWLESRLDCDVRGMWIPERVWEQSMAGDLAAAGIQYTLLDDFHFKNAGLVDDQLYGYYTTEDDGQTLSVLPGSERLRYCIPFENPEATIDYLAQVCNTHPGALVVFGDDGEKFGTWPQTKKHVYEEGWLRQFFQALSDNAQWLQTVTPSTALDELDSLGKLFLPEGSYREMTEWALPASRQVAFESVRQQMQDSDCWNRIESLVRGGFWRNFKIKYPESDEMYARMMQISGRLEAMRATAGADEIVGELLNQAQAELYRGQCNCSYWHGAFGGIYLPHLRNAVYYHLISAENLLHRAAGRGMTAWCEAESGDFNFDGRPEVILANDRLAAFFAPHNGGQMYELDIREIAHNLLATLARRPEAYHEKVLAGPTQAGTGVASIHEQVVFKQEGLDRLVRYDPQPRKSLQDHFFHNDESLDTVIAGKAVDQGDFCDGTFEFEVADDGDWAELTLLRVGAVNGLSIRLLKKIAIQAGESHLEVTYQLEGLPRDVPLHFATEWNFAGLPAGEDDRFFYDAQHNRLGQLGTALDLSGVQGLGLMDQWLGIDVGLSINRPADIWAFPIASVSQSESGFEAIHQSVVVMPHWLIQGDEQGCWGTTIRLAIDTTLAERRLGKPKLAVVS